MKSKSITKLILVLVLFTLNYKNSKAQFVYINDYDLLMTISQSFPGCVVNNQLDTTCPAIVNATSLILTYDICQCVVYSLDGLQYFDNLQYLNASHQPLGAGSLFLPPSLKTLFCSWTYDGTGSHPDFSDLPDSLTHLECTNNYMSSLPVLPNSLITLNCSENQITNISNLPSSLKSLKCSNSLITNIQSLPPNMINLNCSNNYLTSLPSLPNSIKRLDFRTNAITNLPALPSSLKLLVSSNNPIGSLPVLPNLLDTLGCVNNQLAILPTLPGTIKIIECGNNSLNILPNLPSTLVYLNCMNNSLNMIPTLPNGISYFNCSGNNLTSLPSLPNSLKTLEFDHNQITSLPPLPNFLSILTCNKNLLTALPTLPNTLIKLMADSNNISCLPLLPNITQSYNFNISGNPITCLTNYIPAMNATTLALPLCIDNDLINNPAGCAQSTGISGTIYKDSNPDCMLNTNETKLQNVKVKFFNPSTNQFGMTNSWSTGIYYYAANPGTYITLIDTLNKPYKAGCLNPGIDTTVVTTPSNSLATNVNFGLECKPGVDLNVQSIMASEGMVFPGEQHKLQVVVGDASHWYGLNCGGATSGQVQITVNGPVVFNGEAPGALVPTVSGNVFTYNISNFGTLNNLNSFQLLFTTNTTAQAFEQICVDVEVTTTATNNYPSNNMLTLCYEVVNSYDPNYKEVYPKDVLPGFNDWLTYTIHFQNTGTAPAINIKLLDTLDANLDEETFEVINYSHFNTVTLTDGVLDFRFPNILLPDSTSDLAGSQGFVQYRIKPVSNLPVGTQIENTANIYFDYNTPITTNTTVNNFITTVALNDKIQSPNILIYPNPSTGLFNLSATVNVEVYNIIGELISTTNNTKTIDLSNEPNGIYFVKLNGITTKKIIKK